MKWRSVCAIGGVLPLVACVLGQDLGSAELANAPVEEAGSGARASDEGAPDASSDVSNDVVDRDAARDATKSDAPAEGPTGAGPLGALPSGFCCTSDDECRFRKCVDTGGGNRMCLDECSASVPAMCTSSRVTFTCGSLGGAGSHCLPTSGFACLDASTFVRGTRTTGACCSNTGDGNAASECEANLCLAVGPGPWFCTRHCTSGTDCPSDHVCLPVADRKECVPANRPYMCK